jgi:hypothetical protein
MKKLIVVLGLLLLFGGATALAQPLQLRLPDTTARVGTSFLMPVYVDSNLTGRGVLSYQIELSYNAQQFLADSLIVGGTLSSSVSPFANFTNAGRVTVAAASANALTGSGVLFYVRFRVISNNGGYTSTISFAPVANNYVNQGSPALIFDNGNVLVPALPNIFVSQANVNTAVGDSVSFTAQGGAAPYTWSVSDTSRAFIFATTATTARLVARQAGLVNVIATDTNGYANTSVQQTNIANFKLFTRDTSQFQGSSIWVPLYVNNLTPWQVVSGTFDLTLSNSPGISITGIQQTGTLLANASQALLSEQTNHTYRISFASAQALVGGGVLCYVQINLPNLYTYNFNVSVGLSNVVFNQQLTALTANSNITAIALPQLNISPNTAQVVAGETRQFTASNGFPPYQWSVSDTSLATINAQGLLLAKQGGQVVVTATDSIGAVGQSGNIQLFDTRLQIRDTVLITGDTLVDIAIDIESLPMGKTLNSISLAFDYDASRIQPIGLVQMGTPTASWAAAVNQVNSSRYAVALAGTQATTGNTTLFYLRFRVLPGFLVNQALSLSNVVATLNEGNPNFLLVNGQIRSLPCTPSATISPAGSLTFCANQPSALNGPSGTAFRYQWSRNGVDIPTATNRQHTPTQSGTYRLRVSLNASCFVISDSVLVTINPSPIAQITPYADTLHRCAGDTLLLHAFSEAGYSYQWFRNGSAISNATDSTFKATLSGAYTVRTSLNGCQTFSAVQQVNIRPLPVKPSILITGAPVCLGDSAELRIPATALNVQWFNDTMAIPGATDTILRVPAGRYRVRLTDVLGCSVLSDSVLVGTATAAVQIVPAGPTTFCVGQSVQLSLSQAVVFVRWYQNGVELSDTLSTLQVTQTGNYQAFYRISGNTCIFSTSVLAVSATPLPVVTLDSLTAVCANATDFALTGGLPAGGTYSGIGIINNRFFPAIAGPGTHLIRYTAQQNGCSDSASRFITVHALPGSTLDSLTPVCVNAAAFNLGGGLPLGGTYFGPGVLNGLFAPATAGVGNHLIGYTTTNAFGCSDTVFRTITVSSLPIASMQQSGSLSICEGNSIALQAVAASGQSYRWLRNGLAIAGAVNQQLLANLAGSYRVIVTNAAGCFDTSAVTTITVTPLPLASISAAGPTTFCAGNSVQLNAAPSTGMTYAWLLNGLVISAQTAGSLTATSSGNYQVITTNSSGCFDTSAAITVTVNPLPVASISAVGPTTICQGDSVLLTAAPSTGVTYAWLRNGSSLPAQTSGSLHVSTSGNYQVITTNSNGCTDTSAGTIITVSPLPVASISAAGPTTFCAGNSVQLNAAPSTGMTYGWLLNGLVIPAQTAGSLTATSSGNYRVITTNSNGCFDTSAAITITVNPAPIASVSAAGPTTVCAGDSALLNALPNTGMTYQWLLNGAVIPAQTANNLFAFASGAYQAIVTNSSGCADTSAVVSITVNPLPTAPTITVSATSDTLFSSEVTGNQWYLNGQPIVGANGQSLVITQNGSYTATVLSAAGCESQNSNVLNIQNVGLASWSMLQGKVYPNPTSGAFSITTNLLVADPVRLEVFSSTGQLVYSEILEASPGLFLHQVSLETLAAGLYSIRLQQSQYQLHKQLMVVK